MARKGDGSPEEALKRAFKFLSYRARSEVEIRLKLTQLGFSQKITETTLEKLRSLNLLNDETFARGWAREKGEVRGYGPLRVERELRQKGVAQSLIGRIVQETFGQQETKERAKKLLEKRFRGKDLSDRKTLHRAIAFLQRRGYRDSVIAELIGQTIRDD
ncbi:MAG: regulatory protein RecX [Deltaproteobacteria bacterium]|nr:regulatory protein RecX [Deltaproteobacteria bacterium]